MPEARKSYFKEILVGLFITIVGGILVVHYQERLHKKNNDTGTVVKSPASNDLKSGSSRPSTVTLETVEKPDKEKDIEIAAPQTRNAEKTKTMPVLEEYKIDRSSLEPEKRQIEEKIKKELSLPPTENLGFNIVENVKLIITHFEQKGSIAIFHFTLENLSESNPIKEWHAQPMFNALNAQNGNSYKCQKVSLGNEQQSLNLIHGNPVECFLEFNIGTLQLTKAAFLRIVFYGHPGATFEFTNLQIK